MLLEIICPSCGKDHLVLEKNVMICKNIDCPDFNGFFELNSKYLSREFGKSIIIKKGLTEKLIYEDGKWHEKYENGRIISGEQIK